MEITTEQSSNFQSRKIQYLSIVLAMAVFLLPALVFRFVYYLFDVVHSSPWATAVWFSYLAVRIIACFILVYIAARSFKRKASMLKIYAIVFLLCEVGFSLVVDSNGMVSYATLNWHCLYWHPTNSLGYRDHELPDPGKCSKKILTLGDSYTAGYAIESISNRFDYLLKNKLGDKWCTYCAAEPGVETKEELTRLRQYPVKPDIIIWGYYINDMDSVLNSRGIGFPNPPEVTYGLTVPVTGSALLNFLFFKYAYLFYTVPDYYKAMKDAYNNKAVTDEHYSDLSAIISYADSCHAQLIVLVFPELNDLEASKDIYVSKMVYFFDRYPLTVINVSDIVQSIPMQDRFASNTDTHPGIKVQQALADTLFTILSKQDIDNERK